MTLSVVWQPCCISSVTASKPERARNSATSGSGMADQAVSNVSSARSRSARVMRAASALGFNLGDGLGHQIDHCTPDLMVRLLDAGRVEIGPDLSKYVLVAGLDEIGPHHFACVGLAVRS